MKKVDFRGLIAALGIIIVIFFAACSENYDDFRVEPTPEKPEPQTPGPQAPSTGFKQVIEKTISVSADTVVTSGIVAQLENDSLVSRELRFKLGMELSGPDTLVVMDQAATKFVQPERAQTTNGNWYRSGNDSLRNETCVSGFKFSYYDISVTTTNTVGYTDISGHRQSYLTATLTTSASSFTSEWLEEIERNDSIFNREKTNQSFIVSARTKYETSQFTLSKEVIIDHFLRLVEQEDTTAVEAEEPTPEPETVEADYHIKGLKSFLGAKKVYRDDTRSWSDVPVFEGTDSYLEVIANYRVKDDKEEFVSFEEQIVPMTVCPKGDYDGAVYYNGKFYPCKYTINTAQELWSMVTKVNGETVRRSHSEQDAIATGIKNFQGNSTARCTPVLKTTVSEKTVRGLKVITVTVQSSLHTWTVTVADESLK